METTFDLQPLTEQNIPELIALHHSVGWNSAPDFLPLQMKLFLAVGKLFGHRDQGKLITCAGVYVYDRQLASIGPVIVNPAYQRQGLGQQLMERCLEECPSQNATVMLIATEAGQRLYQQIGFETVGYIRRFVYDESKHRGHEQTLSEPVQKREGSQQTIQERNLRTLQTLQDAESSNPLQTSDLPRLLEADRLVIGADRSAFYKQHFANITCGYLLNTHSAEQTTNQSACQTVSQQADSPDKTLPSFGIATLRGETLQIGPLIADDHDHALHLIHQFLRTWQGTLRIDVPSDQLRFIYTLQQLGFVETLISPVMTLGGAMLPGRREFLFAIADPALG